MVSGLQGRWTYSICGQPKYLGRGGGAQWKSMQVTEHHSVWSSWGLFHLCKLGKVPKIL